MIPEIAKHYFKAIEAPVSSLDDIGVSIISLNGLYFEHFFKLYHDFDDLGNPFINIRCAGITDNDPAKYIKNPDGTKIRILPHANNIVLGANPALGMIPKLLNSSNARIFASPYKTFEYDMGMCGNNGNVMSKILKDNWPTDGEKLVRITQLAYTDWRILSEEEKAECSMELLDFIEDDCFGKGYFAQLLSEELSNKSHKFETPDYIARAILWASGFND